MYNILEQNFVCMDILGQCAVTEIHKKTISNELKFINYVIDTINEIKWDNMTIVILFIVI